MRFSNEPWLSMDEIAAHLGVTRDSVYRWIEGRGVPAHEIDAWLRAAGDDASPMRENPTG